MQNNILHSQYNIHKWLYILLLVLLAAAYLVDLGHGALDNETDEGRRALVAAEMIISGDYLTPTLQGEIYLNKPPLYNWIIVASFKLFGNYSMFALRFPVIVSIFISGAIIYFFVKKYTQNFNIAFFSAFAFMTNGRILIYDSLQGLIDITFGWVTFLSFFLIYYFGKKKQFWWLFIVSYLLTACGFLMKGFPALVCQAFTLLVFFIYTNQFKKLFSLQHVAGIICFLIPVAGYYVAYFHRNHFPPEVLIGNLLHESTKRTFIEFGVWRTIAHFISFPFEMLYHYAPWMLFIVVLFQKNVWQKIKTNDFIFYNLLVFIPNFFIYWASPQVYARYLFMVLPLLFNVFMYLYFTYITPQMWQRKIVEGLYTFITGAMAVMALTLPFFLKKYSIEFIWLKSFFSFATLGLGFYFMLKTQHRLLAFCFALCFFRFAFNWFVVENRGARYVRLEETGKKIVALSNQKPLYILQGTQIGEFLDGLTFHICTRRNEVLKHKPLNDYNALYIADDKVLAGKNYQTLMEFDNYGSAHLKLVQIYPPTDSTSLHP